MFFSFPFLFHILNEFFALWSTAFIEAWIDGELVGVDQLSHSHTQQQCLAVTFRNAEATQEFGSYLTAFIISVQDQLPCVSVFDTIIVH